MRILTIDFETYFDDEYTLKKMTTEAYVRDPRFEVICMGVHDSETKMPPHYYVGEDISKFLKEQNWSNTAILAHHAHFDGLILSHHYGIRPAQWLDTLCMAKLVLPEARSPTEEEICERLQNINRYVRMKAKLTDEYIEIQNYKVYSDRPVAQSFSLEALCTHFGLGQKTVPYMNFKGKRFKDLDGETQYNLFEGCMQDCRLTYNLGKILIDKVPNEELAIIDMTIRMFTEPALIGDEPLLRKIQQDEWTRKGDALVELNVTQQQLASAAKFCSLLKEEGVEIETKEGKRGPIPAVAKTDPFLKTLLDHDNPRVRRLVEARLDLKSTINETRAARLADMASRGPMAIYLHYCGAHTTRWSGGDKVNFQNMPRGGDIRKALIAPPGFKLAVCDLSQIECRVLNYLAGQQDVLDAFATGRDLYSEGAARFYQKPIDKKQNPLERHLGKVLELGCGYGMGAKKLQDTCKYGALGGPPIVLSEIEAREAINSYRSSHPGVVNYWAQGDTVLRHLATAQEDQCFHWGPMRVYKGRIMLPNETPLHYELKWREYLDKQGNPKRGWFRATKNSWSAIWGGGLVENVVQALSRVVISQAMVRIKEDTALCPITGVKPLLCTHDEVVYLIPDVGVQAWYTMIEHYMKQSPEWLPGIPLDADGGVYDRYEK